MAFKVYMSTLTTFGRFLNSQYPSRGTFILTFTCLFAVQDIYTLGGPYLCVLTVCVMECMHLLASRCVVSFLGYDKNTDGEVVAAHTC